MKHKKKGLQKLCYDAFHNSGSALFVRVNNVVSLIALISIIALMVESLDSLSAYDPILHIVEYVTVSFFTLEYLARIIGAPHKFRYIISFYGVIDLISIFPTWLQLGNLSALKSARSLHILRFLRLLRLSKTIRTNQTQSNTKAIYRLNLGIYAFALAAVVVVLGDALYTFEGGQNGFTNIPISVLWVFEAVLGAKTLTMVPVTAGGIVVGLLSKVVSLVLLGLVIKIISDLVTRLLLGIDDVDRDKVIKGQV